MNFPLPPDYSNCYSDDAREEAQKAVIGWRIILDPKGRFLMSPEGKIMSANFAPADVRDAFRTWSRNRD